ncbi:RidA family protein [Pseudophaeobacter sp.]|uniref:RidA family protein n=1 Tax=Pseudophaeobacter sp. TaxID=1971739 RepID=UPI003299339A
MSVTTGQPVKGQPVPQGLYVSARRHRDLIYTSGMTPRRDGVLQFSGQIQATDALETHRDAVRLATSNALTAARAELHPDEVITVVLQLTVFLNAAADFTAHARLADYASQLLAEELGSACIGSRAAVGVASLPSNAPVEVTLTAVAETKQG